MKLVDDADKAWRWLSMRFIVLAGVWESLPYEAQAVIPDPWRGYVTLILLAGAGLGRVVKQS